MRCFSECCTILTQLYGRNKTNEKGFAIENSEALDLVDYSGIKRVISYFVLGYGSELLRLSHPLSGY